MINKNEMTNYLKSQWWAIAIIILVVMNIATFGYFWFTKLKEPAAPPSLPRPERGVPPPFLKEELGFTTQQQKQYEQLFREHQQQVRRVKDSIRISKENFFSLLSNSNASAVELERRAAISAQLHERLDMLTFEHFRKVKAICTPQQQQKFDKVIHTVIERMAPPPPPAPGGEGGNGNRPPPPPGVDGQYDSRPPPPGDNK